jgi:hypothetical protein
LSPQLKAKEQQMNRFRKLSQTLWHCQYHIVWVAKYRYRILSGKAARLVEQCIHAFSHRQGGEVIELSIQIDHVYLLSSFTPRFRQWRITLSAPGGRLPPAIFLPTTWDSIRGEDTMRYPAYIEADYDFPEFYHVQVNYPRPRLEDVPAAVRAAMADALPDSGITAGQTVAVAAGSRGIANHALMVKTVCRCLQAVGAKPFILPAMGSHGGATAEGQLKLLAGLGISRRTCGCPVRSSMDADQIGTVFGSVPVFFATDALAADHSICLNRIKPHTKFKAEVESGILKMLCIGMGKHLGALSYHRWALRHGFFNLLKALGKAAAVQSNFRFGLGIVENAYDETMHIAAVPGDDILTHEKPLMDLAREQFPTLPAGDLDILVVQRIGKEISGAGMDPNVTGRAFDLKEDDFSGILKVGRLAVLNLSEGTGGNGIGLGLADIITEKVFRDLDYEATLINALTSVSLRKAFIPVCLPDDRKAIQACFTTLGPLDGRQIRAAIVKDTMHVTQFWASSALVEEIRSDERVTVGDKALLRFDPGGNLMLPGWPVAK